MISPECFERQWVLKKASEIGCRNPVMLEKTVVALQLIGHLTESGLQIQFKGGSSLLLRLNPIRRLSIDVDIVTQATPDELVQVLNQVSGYPPLTGYQHDEKRDKELPPKKHFRVFYPSVIEAKTDHVLLDVLFEKDVSPSCEPVQILTSFITVEREVHVSVPTVNALLGDKLTAFAPHTIGILYHRERKTDIVKQLFDVGVLFDAATDLKIAAEVYEATHSKQLEYRQASYSLDETLNDTMNAAFLLSQLRLKGGSNSEDGIFLLEGITNLANHIVNFPFNHASARIAAGKAACTAAWILCRPLEVSIENLRFHQSHVEELRELQIEAPWQALSRLKGGNTEAFHYWYQVQRILMK